MPNDAEERKVLSFGTGNPLDEVQMLTARRQQDLASVSGIEHVDNVRNEYKDGPHYARAIVRQYRDQPRVYAEAKDLSSLNKIDPIELAALLQKKTKEGSIGKDPSFDLAIALAYFEKLNAFVDYAAAIAPKNPKRGFIAEYAGRSDAGLEVDFLEAVRTVGVQPHNAERLGVLAPILRRLRNKQQT